MVSPKWLSRFWALGGGHPPCHGGPRLARYVGGRGIRGRRGRGMEFHSIQVSPARQARRHLARPESFSFLWGTIVCGPYHGPRIEIEQHTPPWDWHSKMGKREWFESLESQQGRDWFWLHCIAANRVYFNDFLKYFIIISIYFIDFNMWSVRNDLVDFEPWGGITFNVFICCASSRHVSEYLKNIILYRHILQYINLFYLFQRVWIKSTLSTKYQHISTYFMYALWNCQHWCVYTYFNIFLSPCFDILSTWYFVFQHYFIIISTLISTLFQRLLQSSISTLFQHVFQQYFNIFH